MLDYDLNLFKNKLQNGLYQRLLKITRKWLSYIAGFALWFHDIWMNEQLFYKRVVSKFLGIKQNIVLIFQYILVRIAETQN